LAPSASRAEVTPKCGALANAAMEPTHASQEPAVFADLVYLKPRNAEHCFVMMLAGKPHKEKTASSRRQGPPNYRGQNRRFMRVFHRENGPLVSRVVR